MRQLYIDENPKLDDLTKNQGVDIAADAHLVMRLKSDHKYIVYGIGVHGDGKTIDIIRQTNDDLDNDRLSYGLAYGGHTRLLDFALKDAYYSNDYVLYVAIKGGNIDTIQYLINTTDSIRSNYVVYGAYKSNNIQILDYFPSLDYFPIVSTDEYLCSAFIGSAKGGHLELLKQVAQRIIVNNVRIDRSDMREAMTGAQQRGYTDICEYLRTSNIQIKVY